MRTEPLRAWLQLSLLCLAACSAAPVETPAPAPRYAASGEASLYVLRRGRHTDLVIPAMRLAGPLSALEAEFPGARYYVFGFGDRQYVLATHQNLLHSLLAPLPGAGLVLVTGLQDAPENVYGADHLAPLKVEPQQLEAVEGFIWDSLRQEPPGTVRPYMPGKLPGNVYYASSHTYWGFYTCNTWTAAALRSGGYPVRSAGVLFAGQVWDQVRR
jgi:hypothetical protein